MKPIHTFRLLLLVACSVALPAPPAQPERIEQLAGDAACTMCHRESASAHGGVPLAPSWAEIATRYRGRADAEAELTRVVIDGADPAKPHWKNRAEFTRMDPNAQRISPEEARALVRWILATVLTQPRTP